LEFRLIRQGVIEITPADGVKENRPSSSLIICDDFKVVIDIEHPKTEVNDYIKALKVLGLTPGDIDAVIFTHLHPDHIGHKEIFTKAAFVFQAAEKLAFYFKNDKKLVLDGDVLFDLGSNGILKPEYINGLPDLQLLGERLYLHLIPGHTRGSTVIFANISGIIYAWAGDTFLNKRYFDNWEPPGSSWKQEMIYKHMEFIKTHADVIIPGHGAPFEIKRSTDTFI